MELRRAVAYIRRIFIMDRTVLFAPAAARPARIFQSARRVQRGALASLERRCLVWIACRLPAWVGPDHLTALGFVALALAGALYALAARRPLALFAVDACLALNWFGDSLDGTLARVRNRQRPRYGFYIDHIVDSFGALLLLGGLALSGYVNEYLALAALVAFLLFSIECYLATYTIGTFKLSYWIFSPTELRILLAIGNAVAFAKPTVSVLGSRYRFFDVGFAVAIVVMAAVLATSIGRNACALYRAERIR
jgi:archaetidylinositol phosphate synthase